MCYYKDTIIITITHKPFKNGETFEGWIFDATSKSGVHSYYYNQKME